MTKANKGWQKLTAFSHVRARTEMYFGSRDPHTQTVLRYDPELGAVPVEVTWTPAGFTALRELLDNAIDEVVAHGHGDRIDVGYDDQTGVMSVADNGRGIPINWDEDEKDYAATVLLSHTMTGRNFEPERGETRGVNGVGAKGVNFCSEYFEVEITRDGQDFKQRFSEGTTELVTEPAIIFPTNAKTTGTLIRAKLSPKVFPKLILPTEFVAARVLEVAMCYPKLKVFFNGTKIEFASVDAALVGKSDRKPISFKIERDGFSSRFWLLPGFMTDGTEYSHGLVNAIPVFQGGTHIDAFKRGFYSGLLAALARENRKRRLEPNRSDCEDGMLLFNVTQMSAPSFDSQSKTRLITESVAGIIKREMDDPAFFARVIKTYPDWIEAIYERCAARTQKKDLADLSKHVKKAKRQKIEDLEDACATDRSKAILFLAEGKSAISGMIEARDPEIHGGLPLRGKPMNVMGEKMKDIVENETLGKIMNSLGLVPGQRVNRHSLRYGRVYITTDADEDGKNIAALLVNYFHALWPELFDHHKTPYIYVFDTPLIIAVKGKQRKYWYNDDYDAFNPDSHKGWEITRAKGLAALKREDWRHVLANPKLLPIVDDGKLTDTLKLLFDKAGADLRKEWIGL